MSSHNMVNRSAGWADGRPPADRAIVMLGCLGATVTLVTVTLIAAITSAGAVWLVIGPIGVALFGLGAWRAGLLVAKHGYFHDTGDEEDEDESPEGGSGVRFPPDAPDGGGSLEFDWDAFVTGFWDHVDATARDHALS